MPLSDEKIRALIRLANKNPNEHEANLAARKVCEQLADRYTMPGKTAAGKMNEAILKEWTDPKTGDLHIIISRLNLHGDNRIINILKLLKEAIVGPRTWNDVKRSEEPEFRSAPNPSRAGYEYVNDFFRKYGRAGGPFGNVRWSGFDWANAPEKDAPEPDCEPPRYKEPYKDPRADQNFDWVTGNWKKKERPQEKRKCSKCGLEIMTFRIKEDPWVCNFCHWKEYP